MELKWIDGYSIAVEKQNETILLKANREGLLSLAQLMTTLADEAPGAHIHLDQYNSLEDESLELIIERV